MLGGSFELRPSSVQLCASRIWQSFCLASSSSGVFELVAMPETAHRKTAWEFWTGGRKGTLLALSLAKVWALTTLNEKPG